MMLVGGIKAINQCNPEKNNVSLTSGVRLGDLGQTKYKASQKNN